MRDNRRYAAYVVVIAVAIYVRRHGGWGSFGVHPQVLWDRAVIKTWQYLAAMAAWVGFSGYWEYAKRDAAAAVRSETKGSRAVHVVLANVAALLVVLPLTWPGRAWPMLWAVMTAGVVVTWAGLAVEVWARRHLGRNWSGEITIKQDHALIRTGPYARLRHPIYTGILMMYVGTALVTGEWLAVAGAVLAIAAYARKVGLEEKNLGEAFGPAWVEYRRATWALVPGVF